MSVQKKPQTDSETITHLGVFLLQRAELLLLLFDQFKVRLQRREEDSVT